MQNSVLNSLKLELGYYLIVTPLTYVKLLSSSTLVHNSTVSGASSNPRKTY